MTEILRILPHHFEPRCINGVWIVPCQDVNIKIAFDKKYKNTDGFRDLGKFRNVPVLISGSNDEELGSIDNPLPSKSPDSKANYLMWREREINGEKLLIAVQTLEEFTMTSHHQHGSSEEKFRRLVGKLYSYHNEEVMRVSDKLKVLPGDSHLSFTTDQVAITILVQRGEDIVHDYLQQPNYEFLEEQAYLLDNQLGQ